MDPRFVPVQPASTGIDPMLALVLVLGAILLGGAICYVYLSGSSSTAKEAKVTKGGSVFVDAIKQAKDQAVADHAEEYLKGLGVRLAKLETDLLPHPSLPPTNGTPIDATPKK